MLIRRKVWLWLLGLTVVAAVYYPFSPGGSQALNMRKAKQHIEVISPQINSDSRFKDVVLEPFTAAGGSLYVGGEVRSKADADALRAMIVASHPPVGVGFHVSVAEPPSTEPQG